MALGGRTSDNQPRKFCLKMNVLSVTPAKTLVGGENYFTIFPAH
jgi:hypothetical protein